MENKKDYIFQKIIDWIFRKKSILYLLVMALFRELAAINIGDTLLKLEEDSSLQDWYFHYPVIGLNFIFSGGSWNVIWVLVSIIVLFRLSELFEIYFTNNKDKEVIKNEIDQSTQTIVNNAKIEKQINIQKVEKLEI